MQGLRRVRCPGTFLVSSLVIFNLHGTKVVCHGKFFGRPFDTLTNALLAKIVLLIRNDLVSSYVFNASPKPPRLLSDSGVYHPVLWTPESKQTFTTN